jgi:hypothetical protein
VGDVIHVHIDELVLHGFDARDRHAIRDAVQTELRQLLAQPVRPQWVTRGVRDARRDAGAFVAVQAPSGARLGAGIASRIYRMDDGAAATPRHGVRGKG